MLPSFQEMPLATPHGASDFVPIDAEQAAEGLHRIKRLFDDIV
jgi:hypothetical protein